MPGYLIHDGCGNPDMMKNLSYRKGLVAPDYFANIKSIDDFNEFVKFCKPYEMLSYREFEMIKDNSHFGYSSNPNLRKFLEVDFVDLHKPFWMGYLTHLISDKIIYEECVDLKKFVEDGSPKEILHRDWDITNNTIDRMFNIPLLPDIWKLGTVKFIDTDEKPIYIDIEKLIRTMHEIRYLVSDSDKLNEYLKKI